MENWISRTNGRIGVKAAMGQSYAFADRRGNGGKRSESGHLRQVGSIQAAVRRLPNIGVTLN
jgi:hypothetical protein